ncbi:hypothetical protein B0H16DRAFT_1730916 [Mycena metata]|uniref:Uncharacterized protein n=1 Tax=Mycena metata TaxID=1033252 RepID=A0AAD7I6T6_9AGAR|nr:hypothetical protein B0H16DRAFT_1730916 [Mycena metata]
MIVGDSASPTPWQCSTAADHFFALARSLSQYLNTLESHGVAKPNPQRYTFAWPSGGAAIRSLTRRRRRSQRARDLNISASHCYNLSPKPRLNATESKLNAPVKSRASWQHELNANVQGNICVQHCDRDDGRVFYRLLVDFGAGAACISNVESWRVVPRAKAHRPANEPVTGTTFHPTRSIRDNSSTRSSLTTSSTAHARNGGSRLFSLPSSAQGLASSASITLAVRAHAAQDGGPRQEVKRTFLTAGVDHIMTLLETGLSFAGARELMGSDLYSKLTDYSANHFKRSSRLVLSSHFSPGISHWATGAILSYCYCGTAPESDRRHALHRMRLEARLIMARRQGRAPDIRGRVVSRGYPIWALVAPDYYFFVCGDENRENASTLHDEPPPSATNTPPNGTATSSAPATRLFTYLNRYWVKRQRDEGKKAVYQVYTLALIQWHPHLFHRLIHPQRNGGTIDQTLAKKIINSAEATAFKFLNGTEGAAATTGEGAVPPAGGESLGGTGNIPEYLKKAEGRLNEDNEQSNLNPKTPYYPVSSSSVPSTRYPVGLRLTLPLATARPAHPRAHTPPVHRRINTIRFVAGIAESGVGPSAGAYPTTPGKKGNLGAGDV